MVILRLVEAMFRHGTHRREIGGLVLWRCRWKSGMLAVWPPAMIGRHAQCSREQSRQPKALMLSDTSDRANGRKVSSPSASADYGHAQGVRPKLEAVIWAFSTAEHG